MLKKFVFALFLLSTYCSFGQTKNLSVEEAFGRYLVTQDESTAKIIINSGDSVYTLFCKGVLAKDPKEKRGYFTRFISGNPRLGVSNAYLNRGVEFLISKIYDSAILDFTKAIAADPKDAYAYYFRGTAYSSSENFDKAVEDYSKAIKLDGKFSLAYYMRGLAYDEKKDYRNSIADFTQVIKIDKAYDKAYLMRGLAYEQLGDYKQAIKDWTEAKKINKEAAADADAFIERAKKKM